MQYIIDDTPIIEADVLVKQPPLISSEVLVPIKTVSHEETPTVTPLQIIDYSSSAIECAFDVTTEQAEEVVKGVLCGTENPPTFENADYRLLHGQGSMDLAFAGLRNNTEYYLRPYALSNLGYKYGDVVAQRTSASPIPSEYQLVEYIQGTGTTYLNVYKASVENIGIHIQFNSPTNNDSRLGLILGPNAPWIGTGPGGSYRYMYHTGNWNTTYGVYGSSGFVDVYINFLADGKIIEDERVLKEGEEQVFISGVLTLFRISQFVDYGKVYFCEISSGINVVRKFYPVYRKVDNKPGMYDIVNNVFYINQGTGEFTVGPDKEWEE